MHKWRFGSASFLLILAIGSSIAETVQNDGQVYTTLPESVRQLPEKKADSVKLDYETALRPAVLQKRSIANIARLLLGGTVPPNHPLVKYPGPKEWNLAQNIMASLQPGYSGLTAAASTQSEGWAPRQPGSSALQNIQQLFETKAKIIPYTGQVATGLTGLASVKGDLIRQIHSISTQAIAQAAAEAAARALASAAAAHAVTNSISNSINNPGAQTGIKGGWSSFQNIYADSQGSGKTPGEQPGPPYSDYSAHINHYQPPPASYYSSPPQTTPSPIPPTLPPPPPPTPYQQPTQPQQQQPYQPYRNNGYYNLYSTQQQQTNTRPPPPHHHPFTQAYSPAHHARPTLSPNTLIATTPSSVPFGLFGRNAPQPSSTSSLLSSISSLLSASTAAYNAAISGVNSNQPQHHSHPHQYQPQQQQSPTLFSNVLSAVASSYPTTAPADPRPTAPVAAAPSSLLSSGIGASSIYNNHGYSQQPINPISQTGSNYGSNPSGVSPGYFQHPAPGSPYPSSTDQARSSPINPSSNSFNQYGPQNPGANYAQSGANPYNSQSVQSSPQFGNGLERSSTVSGGHPTGPGFNGGPGYSGYNGGPGSGTGHVSGWNTQHAGSSPSASAWPSSVNGYASQTPGNFNNSPGSFGGGPSPAQFASAPGSTSSQQTYPPTYQSSAPNFYAQTQQQPQASYSQQTSAQNSNNQYHNAPAPNYNGIGGIRNTDLSQQRYDQSQSASTMGSDYDNDNNDDYDDDEITPTPQHHSYQQRRRNKPPTAPPPTKNSYSSSRYPSPLKKRPSKRPSNYHSNSNKNVRNHQHRPLHNQKKDVGGENNGKRVNPTGPPTKKGSHFDSAVDVVDVVDASSSVDTDYFVEGAQRYSESSEEEIIKNEQDGNDDKTRWRPKSSAGQRPHSVHSHHSGERWTGKQAQSYKPPSKNVRVEGPERTRTQPEKEKGSGHPNLRNKKVPFSKGHKRDQDKWSKPPKTEAAKLYEGRLRKPEGQQQSGQYKSRDVYTTLPEFVFRVDERPDVFLRPGGGGGAGERGGNRKQGVPPRGRGGALPRLGKTDGGDDVAQEKVFEISEGPKESSPGRGPDKRSGSERREQVDTTAVGGEEEEFIGVSEAIDETARSDVMSDQLASDSGFLASEEFDPEEREAFINDVYADEHHEHSHHHPQQRQDYDEEQREMSNEDAINEDFEEKKKK